MQARLYQRRFAWMACLLCMACMPRLGALGEGSAFGVQVMLPASQQDKTLGYYSLHLAPGAHETLEFCVSNNSEEELQVQVQANTAHTNGQGLIAYTSSAFRDESLTVDFAQLVTLEEPVITIPARGTAIVRARIQMPEQPFEGELLGGFYVAKLSPGEVAPGQGFIHEYVFGIAVRIRQGQREIEPAFVLQGAAMGEIGGFSALVLDIRNPVALVISRIPMGVRVVTMEGEEALAFDTLVSMAPNSRMPYAKVFLPPHKGLQAGDYQVQVTLTYRQKTWRMETPMTIQPWAQRISLGKECRR